MGKHDEMTRYAFISHMEDYMKKLLTEPLKADTDEFLKGHGIDGPKALKILTMKSDPNDENSSVVIKSASIKDNGTDENGKRNKDSFIVKYKIPRKDYTKKMRNLYISLFESNIIPECPIIEEGAWGYGILDNDEALDYQSDTTKAYLLKVMNDIKKSNDSQTKWAKVGVLVDFLKKYKSDELQVTKEYGMAIDFAKDVLKELFNDESFVSSWDDETKIKSSLKKAFNDVSVLRYNEDIMISDKDDSYVDRGQVIKTGGPMPNDGKLMEGLNLHERPLSSTPSPFKSGEKIVSQCPPGSTGDRWAKYVNDNENNYAPHLTDDNVMNEDGEGPVGATNCDSSGQFLTNAFPMYKRKTMYITKEQEEYLKALVNEGDEVGGGAMSTPPVDSRIGHFGYTAPIGDGKNNKNNDFYKEANDHKDIMAKSWKGDIKENNLSNGSNRQPRIGENGLEWDWYHKTSVIKEAERCLNEINQSIDKPYLEELMNDQSWLGYNSTNNDGDERRSIHSDAGHLVDMYLRDRRGPVQEKKSTIHIKEKNKGKFNATKKRTGKSTEELTHSKNPVTRKRAQYALNAARWNKK